MTCRDSFMSFVAFFQLRIANAMVMMILVPQKKIDQLEDYPK